MKNNLSVEEIKKSVEYQWRKHQINLLLITYLFIGIITLFIPFIYSTIDLKFLGIGMLAWLGCLVFIGIIFGGFILFYLLKIRYLIKNYQNFNSYEVILENLSTSFAYKGSIYYTVKIVNEGVTKTVETNPYFSSLLFSKFTPEDFNNKKVSGLHDEINEKFYIIKKVN